MHTKKQPQDGEASNHVLIFSNRSLEPALMAGVPGPLLGEDWTCSWDFFFLRNDGITNYVSTKNLLLDDEAKVLPMLCTC